METQESHKLTLPLAIVAAGALIAGAIFFGGERATTDNRQPTTNTDIEVPKVTEKDHIRGSADAELFVVEYSDTECPFCKVFHNTMKQVLAENDGKVAWVYRHFPIPQLHKKAIKEAEATECAAELGGEQVFWSYIDRLFETTNSNDTLDPAALPQIASAVGLDASAFTACLESGRYTSKVRAQMDEATKAGARGTPYSLILDRNGNVKGIINGAEPLESVKAKLDTLLK